MQVFTIVVGLASVAAAFFAYKSWISARHVEEMENHSSVPRPIFAGLSRSGDRLTAQIFNAGGATTRVIGIAQEGIDVFRSITAFAQHTPQEQIYDFQLLGQTKKKVKEAEMLVILARDTRKQWWDCSGDLEVPVQNNDPNIVLNKLPFKASWSEDKGLSISGLKKVV